MSHPRDADGAFKIERVGKIMGTGMIKNLKAILFYTGAVALCLPPLFVFAHTAHTVTHLIITMPMVIWLMVSFFESIPAELEDAAMIDGCTRWQSFIRIVLPLIRNGIATSAIMSFIFSWNQFLFSLILSGPKTKTVPVAVYNFISYGKIDLADIGAAATLHRPTGLRLRLLRPEIDRPGLHDGSAKGLRAAAVPSRHKRSKTWSTIADSAAKKWLSLGVS